jgi:hypothetical protein
MIAELNTIGIMEENVNAIGVSHTERMLKKWVSNQGTIQERIE